MIFSKYPKYKQGDCWLGYHYIDHRHNHKHNAMLRKKFRSKKKRKYERITWNLNNRILDVNLPLRMAFVDHDYTQPIRRTYHETEGQAKIRRMEG